MTQPIQFNSSTVTRQIIEHGWITVNEHLRQVRRLHGLPSALRMLCEQQRQLFVLLEAKVSDRRRIMAPDHERHFWGQLNESRIQRFTGGGRQMPPPGWEAVAGGCILCKPNVLWQQSGREIGFELPLGSDGASFVAYANPFPIGKNHLAIASALHRPQAWSHADDLAQITRQLVALAVELPGWVVFYNSTGAGASVPQHRHFQAFEKWAPTDLFPLERAARSHRGPLPSLVPNYPAATLYHSAPPSEVVQLIDVFSRWVEHASRPVAVNIIALASDTEALDLYVVPRDPRCERAPGLTGSCAALEILGELVLTTPEEARRLVDGEIDFAAVERVLAAVSDHDFVRYFSSVASTKL